MTNNSQHPLVQIVVRAAWITFWMILIAFLMTQPIGYRFKVDPIQQIIFSLTVSTIVQLFKKPTAQPTQGKTAYQVKYSKLLNMVGGNRETADRLISAYGIDKAILDLERDRQ